LYGAQRIIPLSLSADRAITRVPRLPSRTSTPTSTF
jgi:hypothetical protein